jgi:hypothetical protein
MRASDGPRFRCRQKKILKQLRDMWIALANEGAIVPADDMTKKIADIEKLQQG